MPTFQYLAIDQTGKQKKGKIEAADQQKAERALKAGGLTPVKVTTPTILDTEINGVSLFGSSVSNRDLAVFCSQVTSLLKAGVGITDAFGMMADATENKSLAGALRETMVDVGKGETLGFSMRKHPNCFPPMLINMVEAGEESGSLENSFERTGIQFEKDAKITGMVKKALVYPIIVMVVAAAVVVVMINFVIPNFVNMFKDLNTELPGITVAVMNFADWFGKYWIVVAIILVVFIIAFNAFKATPTGQVLIGRVTMKLPLVGPLVTKTAAARFARTMSTLLSAGISILDAISMTKKNMPNVLYKDAMDKAFDDVSKGTPLTKPIVDCGLFPPLICHMVRIGEETGNVEEMLDKSATYFEEEVEIATQSLLTAMEPMFILLLAGIVMVLIGACLAPMMTMYDALDKL
ncbi:MAG: type II secretion system F family protein [Lachnospiraceae bacterium]|nr:type II secretion system F family protein [Lachnospiraceae bacterium]